MVRREKRRERETSWEVSCHTRTQTPPQPAGTHAAYLGLVGDIGAKVSTHDTVPRGVVLLVEFTLDEGSDILFNVVFFHGLSGNFDGVLLHLFRHVGILDNSFAFRHLGG